LKIVAGLGNPGEKYAGTRHNLGFSVVDALSEKFRASAWEKVHRALVARCRAAGIELCLVKPQTFMNLSGEPLSAIMKDMKASPADLVVVHDDLDLPLGSIKIRKSGGDGGHNGVRSVTELLGTGGFVRVKVGVGRPPAMRDPADHVLSPFEPGELELVRDTVARAVEAVVAVVREGPDRAMNRFNKTAD